MLGERSWTEVVWEWSVMLFKQVGAGWVEVLQGLNVPYSRTCSLSRSRCVPGKWRVDVGGCYQTEWGFSVRLIFKDCS